MTLHDRLDDYFCLSARGSTMGAEFRAGTASFLTLSYLLLVNPHILSQAGVSHANAVVATALSSALACFIIGLGGNLPFPCAPGLGLSAYLTFGLVQAGLCTLPQGLTACFWSGILVLLVELSRGSRLLMRVVPQAIQLAIVVGMGLLIAMIGMVDVGLIQANPKTLVELGPIFTDGNLQLCCAGILLLASLLYHDVKGATLIGIATLTLVDWIAQDHWPSGIFQWPSFQPTGYWDHLEAMGEPVRMVAMLCFCLICVFDISGVLLGLSTLADLREPDGSIPGTRWAFCASAAGTIVASYWGSTPVIVCVEGASGVREGGRTGLTSCVTGCYFVASLVLAPLFGAVPHLATSPVLVLVGVLMMPEAAKIDWDNMNSALPAFLTILLMPLTYSITNGMLFGLAASLGFYITTGQLWWDVQKVRVQCAPNVSEERGSLLVPSYGSV